MHLAERLIVTVDAPTNHPDVLRVQDAFEQILELFELSEASSQSNAGAIVWRLVSVSMNSPLTVVAEAVSSEPGVNIDAEARTQKAEFAKNMVMLNRGQVPNDWRHGLARDTAKRLYERSAHQIGSTLIVFDEKANTKHEIKLTNSEALVGYLAFEEMAVNQMPIKTKEQVGSIEGSFIEVCMYYNKPAFLLKERKTGRNVWCIVSEENQAKIADEADFRDVWSNKRIVASGRLIYNQWGALHRVIATNVRRVEAKQVDLENILDRQFTGGLTSASYLENFREGNLG